MAVQEETEQREYTVNNRDYWLLLRCIFTWVLHFVAYKLEGKYTDKYQPQAEVGGSVVQSILNQESSRKKRSEEEGGRVNLDARIPSTEPSCWQPQGLGLDTIA